MRRPAQAGAKARWCFDVTATHSRGIVMLLVFLAFLAASGWPTRVASILLLRYFDPSSMLLLLLLFASRLGLRAAACALR